MWKGIGPRIAQPILMKIIKLPTLRLMVTVIKTVQYWHRSTVWNKEPRNRPTKISLTDFDKVQKQFIVGSLFNRWCQNIWICIGKKMNLNLYLIPYSKINWVFRLDTKSMIHKRKDDRLDCIEIKNVCSGKVYPKGMTRQNTNWEKILAKDIPDKGFVFRRTFTTQSKKLNYPN